MGVLAYGGSNSVVFQSAPLTEVRGDSRRPEFSAKRRLVSIRSPHRSEGRFVHDAENAGADRVSIRSPHRSEGRCEKANRTNPAGMFQSAPLTEVRGDVPGGVPVADDNVFQSAPLTEVRGDTSRRWWTSRLLLVSIRSPHRSEGRYNLASIAHTYSQGFNPLPSPK